MIPGEGPRGETLWYGDPDTFLCPVREKPCNTDCPAFVDLPDEPIEKSHYCALDVARPMVVYFGNWSRWMEYCKRTGARCPL